MNNHTDITWGKIPWKNIVQKVRRYQADLVEAEQAGDAECVRNLQDQLVQLPDARLLAVRQVTSTNGKLSPGVDGVLWETPERKLEAVRHLNPANYRPQPARRVMIPKGELNSRPIGILTMHDRAMQALYALALDPLAETRADPHSYGFRKYRSAADAIARCEEIFSQPERPCWVLEADIEKFFDTLSHAWLLEHIPLDAEILTKWLTAGYLERGRQYPTEQGLPQGGILSPILANMALDGLESLLEEIASQRRRPQPAYLVRYADDFLVISSSKRLLRHQIQPAIEQFLNERGLRLSSDKTTITHIKKGVNFLGFELRLQRGNVQIQPAAANLEKVLEKVTRTIQANSQATPTRLIQVLTPILRGWGEYYKHLEQRDLFVKLDQQVAERVWKWACNRQTGLLKRRQASRYFTPGPEKLRLLTDEEGSTLYCLQDIPRTSYTPLDPHCNPYDRAWKDYLHQRYSSA